MAITYSEYKLTFNDNLLLGDIVTVRTADANNTIFGTIKETWVNFRSQSFQVSLGSPTANAGEISALNYLISFSFDFNNTGLYEITRNINEITVKAKVPSINFAIPQASDTSLPASVVLDINNFNGTVFNISDISFSEAVNPCTHVLASVTTSELATNIIMPYSGTNTNNPFTFEITRFTNGIVKCENSTGDIVENIFTTPSFLSSANIEFNVISNPVQSTVTVSVNNSNGLIFQYSINNIDWQDLNIFNLAPGDYIVYIKDQYGCSVSKSFTVDSFGIELPYFEMSESNSIRYKNLIEWDNVGNYKTPGNTLSHEANVPFPKMEIQPFQSSDDIPTQFKTNYRDISAVVINEDGSEDILEIVKKTNNIGRTNKRDAQIYSIESDSTKSGIYFTVGSLYNYDTGIAEEDYVLYGALPEWGIQGEYLEFNGSYFLIENIVFDEDKNANVLIITYNHTGNETNIIVSSIYKIENYEVYEYNVDFVNYIDKQISVKLTKSDPNYPSIIHLSELLDCKVYQPNTTEFKYKNETNTDILYSTGIEHKLRLFVNRVDAKPKSTLQSHDTDSSTILLNAQSRDVFVYTFHPMTLQLMLKVKNALLHEIIQINGEHFVSASEPEIEGALGDTNWYIIKATMVRTNGVYNSQTGGETDFNISDIEIPNLIASESGFITY